MYSSDARRKFSTKRRDPGGSCFGGGSSSSSSIRSTTHALLVQVYPDKIYSRAKHNFGHRVEGGGGQGDWDLGQACWSKRMCWMI